MFFSCKYAALALPIRAFTSASDPPYSSMMLPKYVNVFTCSKSSPSIVIGLLKHSHYLQLIQFNQLNSIELMNSEKILLTSDIPLVNCALYNDEFNTAFRYHVSN
ncbi:unnamed protein product [Schistosoma curassoni]|uniref:Secreted protein n=1 Tax=Schistosoma curassoni TaxID=6186 RepID=A0A183L0C9_9TREM|nr:unnamed protein product [Schistosoma curassoni]